MDQKPFPWLKAVPPQNDEAPETREAITPDGWQARAKKAAPLVGLVVFLALLMAFRRDAQSPPAQENNRGIDALVLMIATPKGQPILAETLKEVPIDRKSLSKNQLLQLMRVDDFIKVQERVRTKKDLPPNKPLFWSDLEFKALVRAAPQTILYSKE